MPKQRRPGGYAPIGKRGGAAEEKFLHRSRLGRRGIQCPLPRRSPSEAKAKSPLADRNGERLASPLKIEAPDRSGFLKRTRTVVDNPRNTQPELKAAQTARIISN